MNIRPRGKNLWQCVWLVGRDPETGKWRRRYETVEGNREQAEAYWHAEKRKIDHGTAVVASRATVAEWLEDWYHRHAADWRPRTQRSYWWALQTHVIPVLGRHPLRDLRPPMVAAAIAAWRNTPRGNGTPGLVSARTVRYCFDLLRMALDEAERWQLVERNVARLVDAPPTGNRIRDAWWTAEEARQFLEVTAGTHWGWVWQLALATGLRNGELRGLQWDDIDWQAGLLAIRRTLDDRNQAGPPKTDKGARTIALDQGTLDLLRARHATARAVWVVATRTGNPVSGRNLARAFARAVARAGLPPMPFHGLRHTHASLLLEAGMDDRALSDRLGHAQIAFTRQIYVHAKVEAQRAATERLAAMLRGG